MEAIFAQIDPTDFMLWMAYCLVVCSGMIGLCGIIGLLVPKSWL